MLVLKIKIMKNIKRTIIKWSLREIVKVLKKHPDASFGAIEQIGLEDFSYSEKLKEYTLIVKG